MLRSWCILSATSFLLWFVLYRITRFFLFSVFSKTKLMFALISIIFSFLPHLFLLISATWLLVLALTSYFPYLCHEILNHRLSELEGNRPALPPRFTKKPRGEGHVPEILQLVREHPHSRFRLLPLLTTLLHSSLSLLPCSSFPWPTRQQDCQADTIQKK